jgi:ATP phosphoribosyltransferase regulatory subunit
MRGGPEVLDRARGLGGDAVARSVARLESTYEVVAGRGVADRVSLDLGLLRDLGYYTGAILEVYDPALGHILGGGGRYDELIGRFGRPLPAAGFALHLERLHVAQAEEERAQEGTSGTRTAL